MRAFLRRTRVHLTATVAAAFLLIAVAVAVLFWLTFAHIQYSTIDLSLASYGRSLLSGLEDVNGTVTLPGGDQAGQTDQGIAVGVALLDRQGRMISSAGTTPPAALLTAAADRAIAGRRSVTSTVQWAGQPQRILAMPAQVNGTAMDAMVLSQPVGELQQTLFQAGALLTLIVLVLGAVVVVLAYLLTGRTLRPVRVIAAMARDISERDLHRRVDLDLPPDELGELAATFNGMLSRLEAAFETLQQVTADAAHELRAPLALLRAELEVSLRLPRTAAESEASQRVALSEAERLGSIVDRLLILARADSGALEPSLQALDVADMVDETAERWRRLAHGKGIRIEVICAQEGRMMGDPELLRRLLDNLMDNALRHTPAEGQVSLEALTSDTTCEIGIADTGEGVAPSFRRSLFQRFTRDDPARARDSGGAGLGLAVCRVIAEAHGGSIHLDETVPIGARFVVRLPMLGSARPGAAATEGGPGMDPATQEPSQKAPAPASG